MTELLHKDLTQSILRAYYDVYNGTSRVYPERFYDRAMVHDLRAVKIRCIQQPEYQIIYKRVRPVLTGYAKKKGGADKKRNQSNDWLRF